MKNNLAAERYAGALADAVAEPESLDNVREHLNELAALCRESESLYTAITNPAHPAMKREAILRDVLDAMKMPEVVQRFARVLFRRRRFELIFLIADRFEHIVNDRQGRRTAHVISAEPLDPEGRKRVCQGLERYCGCAVQPRYSTDPELIGGVVVQLNGTVLDGSLRSQLRRLRETLLNEES